jgi:hypothetical protein
MTAAIAARGAPGAAELSGLYTARAALEASRDLGEVKHIRDTALAAKRYAEAKKLGAEMTGYAQEIVNRAERRIGQLLAGTPKDPGGRPKTGAMPEPVSSPHRQAGKKLSARSQRLALLDEETFEANVRKPTTRIERIARDRLAEARRREYAQAVNDIAPITGWERTERVITLASKLRSLAGYVHSPQFRRDATGAAYAGPWGRPGRHSMWDLHEDVLRLEDGAAEVFAAATAEARAELDAAISVYETALADAAERARAAADHIAALLSREAADAPATVLYKIRGYRATSGAAP